MTNPCPGYRITTPYGITGPSWGGGMHTGVDYAAPAGKMVVAAWSGVVTGQSWGSAFGIGPVIALDPLPGQPAGCHALYAHLSKSVVAVGQRLGVGQQVGLVGSTGNSTGPHLHFEIQRSARWSKSNSINPAPWINAGSADVAPPPTGSAPAPPVLIPKSEDDMILQDHRNQYWILHNGKLVNISAGTAANAAASKSPPATMKVAGADEWTRIAAAWA